MLRNLARVFIVLFVLLAGMAVPVERASAAAPTIVDAVASPNMISLFGENHQNTRNSPFGPSWAGIVVKTTGSSPVVTGVTAQLGNFLIDLLPADAPSRVLSGSSGAWTTKIAALNATALTETGVGTGLWRTNFAIEDLFGPVTVYFGSSVFRHMVEQELRTGSKTVTVIANNGTTPTPGTVTLWVVDAQIMLRKGWNLRSSPMALADTTWSSILALGGKSFVGVRYNSSTGAWQTLSASDTISSLDGVYIYASQDDAIGSRLFRSSAAVVQPASKNLYRGAWNLIGTAPDFTQNFSMVTSSNMRGLLRVDDVLKSVEFEWATIISPGETNDTVTQTYSYTGVGTLGTYAWKFGAPSWSVNRGELGTPPVDALGVASKGATVPFAGYWVFIQTSSAGVITPVVLAGKNSGILTDAWLFQLFTTLGP